MDTKTKPPPTTPTPQPSLPAPAESTAGSSIPDYVAGRPPMDEQQTHDEMVENFKYEQALQQGIETEPEGYSHEKLRRSQVLRLSKVPPGRTRP